MTKEERNQLRALINERRRAFVKKTHYAERDIQRMMKEEVFSDQRGDLGGGRAKPDPGVGASGGGAETAVGAAPETVLVAAFKEVV